MPPWLARLLLGVGLGVIVSLSLEQDFSGFAIVAVLYGFAGLAFYKHKTSLVILALSFLVAGILINNRDFNDFIEGGTIFGPPGGALISRILCWFKVIK
jgi:hypothetical protein